MFARDRDCLPTIRYLRPQTVRLIVPERTGPARGAAKADVCWTIVDMTTDQLRLLLESATGEAVPTLLSLLAAPGAKVDVRSEGPAIPTSELLMIYRRRAKHVKRIGLPTLGFDEAVEKLETTDHKRLTVALAQAQEGHPKCVAFLTEDGSRVVAALAVLGPPPADHNEAY